MRLCLALVFALAGRAKALPPAPSCAIKPRDFSGFGDVTHWGLVPLVSQVELTRGGGVYWNGDRLEGRDPLRTLDRYVALSAELSPVPRVALDFQRGVNCSALEQARTIVRRHLDCRSEDKCLQGRSGL